MINDSLSLPCRAPVPPRQSWRSLRCQSPLMLEIRPEAVANGNSYGVDKKPHRPLRECRLCAVVHQGEPAARAAPPMPKLHLSDTLER